MDAPVTYEDLKSWLLALALSQPRILAMFIALPLFNTQVVPGLLRFGAAGALGLLTVPLLHAQLGSADLTSPAVWTLLVVKEAFIGFVLGYLAAIPFWTFEAVGFLIDNQRGASISSTLNPLTGNDSSPMGILMNQAFIVFFLVSGGFGLLLGGLYDSFRLWSVTDWAPQLHPDSAALMLEQLNRLVRMALLLAAPAMVAMFLAELGLALVSRFAPQLQVFFVAMPVKSGLAVLILILYAASLFDYGSDLVDSVGRAVPFLNEQWGR
ncbi:type III secretion system export apparatus subunit SctT [Comamonas flocculans]|uniref:EscT/YscT/HrcT family type III secretion system export apparatus protein n=1 Tax=Comamonas flocculans TaxID=2597701 RepID=A0A5B8RUD1_9BURK|nr:type III secretion system export apparatus subunit SctT [Comamonas flocculans]QEA13156.1 EscT/YscT/HrcT family type III secretion system export apparatus protein [Comamonas flocculans]